MFFDRSRAARDDKPPESRFQAGCNSGRVFMMLRSTFLLTALVVCIAIVNNPSPSEAQTTGTGQWKITSIKVCRSIGGTINPTLQVLGQFPVYTFFIPRPVWTVNGTVVDAQPVYERGRLVAFQLLGSASSLNSGTRNNVKFSLPDQNNSKVFYYDQNKVPAGDCYEFF